MPINKGHIDIILPGCLYWVRGFQVDLCFDALQAVISWWAPVIVSGAPRNYRSRQAKQPAHVMVGDQIIDLRLGIGIRSLKRYQKHCPTRSSGVIEASTAWTLEDW
jgi:hypothetical protein